MRLFIALLIAFIPCISNAQSVTLYLCNDCTYKSSRDSETITFNNDGSVKINGVLKPGLRCENYDGTVRLYQHNKLVNELPWQIDDKDRSCTLMDRRGICYSLVKCTGNMPSVSELMNGPAKANKRKKGR